MMHAKYHRMSPRGNLYCLKLNGVGERLRDARTKLGFKYDAAVIHNISVRYLQKGGFTEDVGETIKEGLSTYLPKRGA